MTFYLYTPIYNSCINYKKQLESKLICLKFYQNIKQIYFNLYIKYKP